MRLLPDLIRYAPMRRLAFVGLVFVAAIVSCGKDLTGPVANSARYARGLSFNPVFPPAFQAVGGAGSGVVQFTRVHVVLHHNDGTIALDTTIDFPSGADSLTLSLTVKLLDNAPASGEPMSLNLGYLNAAGDTVFKGGPVSITAAPPPPGGGSNPPVNVPVTYSGPGANAVSVAITPRSGTVVAGAGFNFAAVAKDAGGNTIASTPIIWNSLDPTIATITSAAAGAGIAQSLRGTARIVAQLFSGAADTVPLTVTLPASQLIVQSGNAQAGIVGANLPQPLVVKVAASDGVGVAGTTVNFAVAAGGGSIANASVVSDANGLAQTSWKLGTGTGAQSVTATSGVLAHSPLTFTATAQPATATKLVVTTQPVNGIAGTALAPIVVTAEDSIGNVATTFTGAVSVAFGTSPTGATLGGTATVNAVAGVATFSTLTINKNGTAYTLVASTAGLTSATTSAFDIAVGAPSKLVFTVQPAGGTASNALTPAIVVNAQDSQGNPTPSFTGAVTLAFGTNPTGATLGGTLSATAVAGAATFSNATISLAGTGYTLAASATGLTAATSAQFNIGGGVATTLALSSGGGQTGAPSAALAAPIVVQVTDAGGNPIAGTTVTFAILTGGGSMVPASGVSNLAGQVQTVWTLGSGLGAQSLSASSAGLTGSPITINATASLTSASKTWTGATSTQWSTASNWSPAGAPSATDSVLVPATTNHPLITASTTIASIIIQSGGPVTVSGAGVGFSINGRVDATGGILGLGGATVVLNGTVSSKTLKGLMNVANLTFFGPYSLNGAFVQTGPVVINSGGSLFMNGNAMSVTGDFSTAGTGTLTENNAADGLVVTGNVSFGGGSTTGQITNGLLSVSGNFTQSNSATSFSASGAHQVAFVGTSAQNINFANPGSSQFAKLTLANSAGVSFAANVVAASDVTVGGPVISTFGLTIGGQLIDPTGAVTVGAISFQGSANPVAASTPTINTSVTFNSGSTLLANLTVNGGVNVNSASGNLSAGGHTLTISGGLGTANSGAISMSSASDLIIVGGSVSFGGTSGPLTNGVLQIGGNFTQTVAPTAFVASSPHITRFTGATPTISFANPTTSNFGTLQFETSGAVTFATDAATSFDVWLKTGTTPSVTSGGHTVSVGRILYDTTGGRWQVTNTVMTGSATLPRRLTTNLTFTAGGVLTDSAIVTGAVTVSGASTVLDLNGHYMKVTGAFGTASGGALKMIHANDSLVVKGNATFNGGSTAGLLTNGYFEFDGSTFVQGVNTSAFAATAPHITWFWGNTAQTVAFANPSAANSHFGNLYLQDTATVLSSDMYLTGQFQTGGQSSFHVEAAAGQLVTSNGSDLRNIVFDNVRWKLMGTNGNGLFPSLDNVIFQNISQNTLPQFDYEYSVTTNLSLPGFTFSTVPSGGGVYIKVVGPDTLTMSSISPATNGGFISVSGGGAVNGWSNTDTWMGSVSTAWATAANWSNGVPNTASDVVINTGSFQPTTGAAITVNTVTVNSGATLSVTGGNLTVSGLINVNAGGKIALPAAAGIIAQGDVVTDTTGTTGITSCAGGQSINLQAGSHNITGKFCNLSILGTATATGPIQVVGTGVAGFLLPGTGGNLIFSGHRVDVAQFTASGTGTITMQNAIDTLYLHTGSGQATFAGGAETGLMTAGVIIDRAQTLNSTGLGFDATGTQKLIMDTTMTQSLNQSLPVYGHGFHDVVMKNAFTKSFLNTTYINGNLLLDATLGSTGTVSGSVNVYVGSLTDNSSVPNGAFQGSTSLHITGNVTSLPPTLIVNTLTFQGGGNSQLSSNLTTNYVVVDSASGLVLNNHTLDTQGNSFTTQNGGVLSMTNTFDTLRVGAAYFNGGASVLTKGDVEFATLYQGYDGASQVASASANAFSPTAGLTAHIFTGVGANIYFKDPGTGSSLSHFWYLQLSTSSTARLRTSMFVDSLLEGNFSGANLSSDSAAQNVVRTITTKGLSNTTAMSLGGVNIVLNDGVATSSFFNNVTWNSFPGSYTGTLLTLNRTSSAPSINFNNFSAVSLSGPGEYISSIGSLSTITLGLGNIGGCIIASLGLGGHCP